MKKTCFLKRKTEIKEKLKLLNSKWLFRNGTLLGYVCVHSLPAFKTQHILFYAFEVRPVFRDG